MSIFQKATRLQTKLRMAITGPAGSGKTLGALLIARGLVGPQGRIALIDTENGSASYYADKVEFDTLQMGAPYEISKYIAAIKNATADGFDCIVVDSLSHAWSGEGGILQKKEQMDARGGNSFANWGKLTPEQNTLVNAILHSKTNIICTMRSKMEYSLEKDEKGKTSPKKLGLAPEQRQNFEYEFDVVLDVDLDTHTAKASKDRTEVFLERIFKITQDTGEAIKKWQMSGKVLDKPAQAETPQPDPFDPPKPKAGIISEAQRRRLFAITKEAGWRDEEVKAFLLEYGYESSKDIETKNYNEIVDTIQSTRGEAQP